MNRLRKRAWLGVPPIILFLGIFLSSKAHRPAREPPETPSPLESKTAEPVPRVCEETLELVTGQSLGHDLAGGEACSYDFHLDAGDYLELVVDQHGIDVAVTLLEPGSGEEIRVDSRNGAFGPERVQLIGRRSGRHRLEIRSEERRSPPARYEVRIETLRAATPEDHDRDRGARVFSEADKLRRAEALDAAAEQFRRALGHWQAVGEPFQQAVTQARIGRLHQQRREWRQALRWYRQSLEQFGQVEGSKRQVPKILNDLGACYRKLGDGQNALESYEKARRLARQVQDPREEASSLNNIAIAYKSFGRSQQAITHYERAIALWQEIGNSAEEAKTWVNVGWLYVGLGQPEKARGVLEEALRLTHDPLTEARALSTLGRVQRRLGLFDASLDSLERSLALRRDFSSRPGEAMTLKGLGSTHLQLGEIAKALRAYEEALDLARRSQDRRIEGVVLNALGWLYNEALDEPERALDRYEDARMIFQETNHLSEKASSFYGAARAHRKRRDLSAARSSIEEALDLVEALRTEPDDPRNRAYYLADKQDYYELYIDVLIKLDHGDSGAGYAALALEVSERRRARTLLDVLNASVVDREMELVLRREEKPEPEGPLRELSTDRDGLWPRLSPTDERPTVALSFDQIQRLLDDDTLLLEYSLGEARSFLWLVSPTDFEVHELPPRSEIEKLARSAYDRLSSSYRRRVRGPMQVSIGDLSRLLLGPVADRLGTKRLLVVGEEALQYIPFAALPIPWSETRRARGWLVEEHEIVSLPSLSILAFLREQAAARPPAPGLVAVVADPVFHAHDPRVTGTPPVPFSDGDPPRLPRLELSHREAERILSLVPEDRRFAAFDFDANKQVVAGGGLASYRFVHLATHALFDPLNPELMGVALSMVDEAGGPLDGLLRPHEIYHLSLPVDMVVLSACQSGLGKEVRGEGLVGLTQGFFHAGASRVVVSYWKVDDRATAELMGHFYRGIFKDGLRPAAALRAAQLSMLGNARWQAPYYWAGFFLQGEWR